MPDQFAITAGLLGETPRQRFLRLQALRQQHWHDPQMQALLGPIEHRAFIEALKQDHPAMAYGLMPLAIPAWTAYKKASETLGYPHGSPASLEEMSQAYKGLLGIE